MEQTNIQELKEWVADCKTLPRAEVNNYGSTLKQQKEVTEAIYRVFESNENELRDSVCGQLFEFYRSYDPECKRFCLQYIPSIIYYYLTSVVTNRKRPGGRVEALLLAIYNLDLVDADGLPKVKSFIIPTLAKPSIYHEPVHLSSVALTETALSSHQKGETHVIKSGPYPQEEMITAQNRFSVLSHVLYIYNSDIARMPRTSHEMLCKMCSRLCTAGYPNTKSAQKAVSPSSSSDSILSNGYYDKEARIQLSADFMVEMLNGIYFVQFNGLSKSGYEAMENIHDRACQELYSEVILVTNAIKNSLSSNPSGAPTDGPIGISIAVTPSTPTVKRAAITNASFKARRLSRVSVDGNVVQDDGGGKGTQQIGQGNHDGVDGITDSDSSPVTINIDTVDVAFKINAEKQKKIDTVHVHIKKETTNGDGEPVASANQGKVLIAPASHSREINASNAGNTVEPGSSPGRMETRL
ncbi:hyccin-like [Ptychodera flava]|uniref:hyccin-like n=1 Tax=Ptychodera flava TaxID=63121 RepID=UPI00396A88CA